MFGFDCSQSATADMNSSVPAKLFVAGIPGSVSGASGVGVKVPSGAFTQNTTVSISVYLITPTLSPTQATLTPVGPICDFQPEGVTFAQNVDLTLAVDSAKYADEVAKGKTFKVHFLNKSTQLWVDKGGVVDPVTNTITTQTDHVSTLLMLTSKMFC